MPPDPPAPGTESATAEKSGTASPPSAATAEARKPRNEAAATAGAEESPAPAEATAGTEKTRTEPAATAGAEETRAPAGAPAGAGDPPTAAAAPSGPATGGTTDPPEGRTEGIALATAVAAKPETKTLTVADRGRPRTPVLAGAVFVGAALVAIPVLLMGSANDEKPRNTGTAPVAGSGDTVLDAESAPAALDDYVAVKPTPSPTEQKKKTAVPKAVPAPVAPTPAPRTSAPAEKPKASPKPKPEAAPKPDWGTQTVSATSSIGVGQSWATNRIRMTMQQDGNLVVYNEQNKPIWAAMTFGENHRAIFQPDGNLVVHNGDDRAIWASKTHDFGGAQLVLRPDAKVVVVHNGRVVWST